MLHAAIAAVLIFPNRRSDLSLGAQADVVSLAPKSQSYVYLESLSEKFKKDITDERGYRGNFKIGSGKNITDSPNYTPFLPHASALKFSHQKIRIEQEDDKTHLDHRSPDIFLHNKYRLHGHFN